MTGGVKSPRNTTTLTNTARNGQAADANPNGFRIYSHPANRLMTCSSVQSVPRPLIKAPSLALANQAGEGRRTDEIIHRYEMIGRPTALALPLFGSPFVREMAIFVAVGGTSALLYALLGAAFTIAGVRPSIAIIITLSLLMPPTYLAQRYLTFRSDRAHRVAFPRYVGTQLVGNGIGIICAEAFPILIASKPFLAFVVIAAVVAATNYLCLKFWAFGGIDGRSRS